MHQEYQSQLSENYSLKLILYQKQHFHLKVNEQMKHITNPFDSVQISQALKNLDQTQQRKQLLNQLVKIRSQKKKQEELEKQQQMQRLLQMANNTKSYKLNTNYYYHKDFEAFESIQQQRYRFESERIENFYKRNENRKDCIPRVTSLNCLTTEYIKQKLRKQPSIRTKQKTHTLIHFGQLPVSRSTPRTLDL